MNLKEMSDEELIRTVNLSISDKDYYSYFEDKPIVDELLTRYTSLVREREEKGQSKEIDPDCWSMLLCGTSTLNEWFEIESYIIKRTKESRGIAPYKHGYYGFYGGNFYFSETGPFAPVISYEQFLTIKNK